MKQIKILVCCHKRGIMAKDHPYMPIQDGKAISDIDLGIQGDDEGDNISGKDASYCELTGMYWAWKNLKNIDVIGLCHYRRYFDFHDQCDKTLPLTRFGTDHFNTINLDIPQIVIDNVERGIVYVAKSRLLRESPYANYCRFHISDDIKILEKYIETTQSEEIKSAWHRVMHRSFEFFPYNMFIMSWEKFDSYCAWLFSLLNEIESQIDISHRDFVQKRVFGYMAERLLNVWLLAQNFELQKTPIILFDDYTEGTSYVFLKIKYYFLYFRKRLILAWARYRYSNFSNLWS